MPTVDPDRARRRELALRASLVVGGATALTAVSAILQSEPAERLTAWTFLGLLLAMFAIPAFAVVAVVQRRPVLVLAPLAGAAVFLAGVAGAEDLHWRWSEADFEAVAASDDPAGGCAGDDGCTLGWWRVSSISRDEDLTVVALPTSGSGCDESWGLVRPADGASVGADDLVERFGDPDHVSVSTWHGAWFEVCITP